MCYSNRDGGGVFPICIVQTGMIWYSSEYDDVGVRTKWTDKQPDWLLDFPF